ncbi:MAG: hypothetical protein ACE5KK_01725 [Candidatus Brocadiales bacterium]
MKLALVIITILALCSCATYYPPPEAFPPDYTGPAFIEGSPWSTEVASGSSHYIFAKVMDKYRNPLAGQTVTASFEYEYEPVAYFYDSEEALTNENGVAEFLIVGLGWPGYNEIIFSSGEAFTRVYIWTYGYGPFGW